MTVNKINSVCNNRVFLVCLSVCAMLFVMCMLTGCGSTLSNGDASGDESSMSEDYRKTDVGAYYAAKDKSDMTYQERVDQLRQSDAFKEAQTLSLQVYKGTSYDEISKIFEGWESSWTDADGTFEDESVGYTTWIDSTKEWKVLVAMTEGDSSGIATGCVYVRPVDESILEIETNTNVDETSTSFEAVDKSKESSE